MPDIDRINSLSEEDFKNEFLILCGSTNWVKRLEATRPFNDLEDIKTKGKGIWLTLERTDWLEAISKHPKIGDLESLKCKFGQFEQQSKNEQASINNASEETLLKLRDLNETYLNRFGFIFITCATKKSALTMLKEIEERIMNDVETEIKNAATEQYKITEIRMEKLQ